MNHHQRFRVTASLGAPDGLVLLTSGMNDRFAWLPFVGIGSLFVENGAVRFEPSRFVRWLWSGKIGSAELRPSYCKVREVGPSDFGSSTIYAPLLGSLLARVAFLHDDGKHLYLQIGVKGREQLLDILVAEGWSVERYTKTIWPWQKAHAQQRPGSRTASSDDAS
jgi:hypothetical protein